MYPHDKMCTYGILSICSSDRCILLVYAICSRMAYSLSIYIQRQNQLSLVELLSFSHCTAVQQNHIPKDEWLVILYLPIDTWLNSQNSLEVIWHAIHNSILSHNTTFPFFNPPYGSDGNPNIDIVGIPLPSI